MCDKNDCKNKNTTNCLGCVFNKTICKDDKMWNGYIKNKTTKPRAQRRLTVINKEHKFCDNWSKCCSKCMNKYTHLCNNSCFYKPNFSCKECKHSKN